ncbi:hypothetical protein CEXT_611011 [Caerostris extrusa]|uniref:Uncharacterized protein n=1 Tax=Caerostris extrusa TaxID=172846 RepID=A0AAV4M3Y7_CAEEX|nr:hypothetical protein CEXT_611011 [Caerostris extrusa]
MDLWELTSTQRFLARVTSRRSSQQQCQRRYRLSKNSAPLEFNPYWRDLLQRDLVPQYNFMSSPERKRGVLLSDPQFFANVGSRHSPTVDSKFNSLSS